MSVNVIAKRYAEALFQIGKEKDTLDTLVEQFTLVKNSFQENEQVIVYLKHPRIQEKEKLSFINKTFDQFETVVINTLKLLVERHRRSEEHTSELQSRGHLVCRLLLEK